MNAYSPTAKQDLLDFLLQYPAPPDIPRGQPKKQISVYLSEQEYRLIQKLTHHSAFTSIYNGHHSDVIRHAIYYMVYLMEGIADAGELKLPLQELKDSIRDYSLTLSRDGIADVLDRMSVRFHTLLDVNEIDAALDEYEDFRAKINKLQPWWRKVFLRMADGHQEMVRFRDRLIRMDRWHDLRQIEERYRDEE